VAHILGKAQAKERQRHLASPVLLPHQQQHPAAALAVVDVALAGGGGFAGEALALPVELPRGDGVIVVAGGGGEQAFGLLEGDEEDVAAGGFIEAEGFCAAVEHPFHQLIQPKRSKSAILEKANRIPMPLRSASEFPITPDPEALEGTYQDCRAALVSANRSRGVLKAQSDRRGVVITELQRELVELEADLADEARAKARLHALNAKLGTVIRELEETGDAMVGLIDESERQSGFWLVEMFRRLVQQATRWRMVKAKAVALAAETAEASTATSELGGQP